MGEEQNQGPRVENLSTGPYGKCGLQIAGLQKFRHRRGPVPGIGGHGASHGLGHPQPVRRVGVDNGGGNGLRLHQPPGGVVGVGEHAVAREIATIIPGVGDEALGG